jgi:hypothetical protein
VRLALFVLAYNLGNFLRRFTLPAKISHRSLSSVQLKLIKIGAKVINHSRRTVFQMAEVAMPGELFAQILAASGPLPPSRPETAQRERQPHMQHASSAQASPDIAEIEAFMQ